LGPKRTIKLGSGVETLGTGNTDAHIREGVEHHDGPRKTKVGFLVLLWAKRRGIRLHKEEAMRKKAKEGRGYASPLCLNDIVST